MRTKTLLASIVLGASCAGLMQAQVYSSNAVGYVNKTFTPGFQSAANPLKGEGDTVTDLFGDSFPLDTVVWTIGASGGFERSDFGDPFGTGTGAWLPDVTLDPGTGFLVDLAGDADVTITFVGEVLQGALENNIAAGFTMQASQVPQALNLDDDDANFPAAEGDVVYVYVDDATGWSTPREYGDPFGLGTLSFTPAVTLDVAEGFLINTAEAKTWARTFSVNNP
jgi:hypothetical protein